MSFICFLYVCLYYYQIGVRVCAVGQFTLSSTTFFYNHSHCELQNSVHMISFMLVPYYVQMSWYPARAEVWKFSFSFYLISDENILEEVK